MLWHWLVRRHWSTLRHQGPLFAPPYQPHSVPLMYRASPKATPSKIILPPPLEELATLYAAKMQTVHAESPVFKENFWRDFLSKCHQVDPTLASQLKEFAKCDFSLIHKHLTGARKKDLVVGRRTVQKKTLTSRKAAQITYAKEKAKYGTVEIDKVKQLIGNFRMEPPSLFIGRGNNPAIGRVKDRVHSSDVTLNLDKDAPIPTPSDGGQWGAIVHLPDAVWLAKWKCNVTDRIKYMFPDATSDLRTLSDREKFDNARLLAKKLPDVRRMYMKDLKHESPLIRQIATAVYLIDTLAIRVGGDKDEDTVADTVGCCSLRVEHLSLDKATSSATLDFLGKDAIHYQKTFVVPPAVFANLKQCLSGKSSRKLLLFHLISATKVNNYLKEIAPELSAKVFRTCNSSLTLEAHLNKVADNAPLAKKLDEYMEANKQVALLCNHRKAVDDKAHAKQVDLMQRRIDNSSKLLSTAKADLLAARKALARLKSANASEAKLRAQANKVSTAERKVARLALSIEKNSGKKEQKEDLKGIALSTSRTNYLDPRISVSWSKRNDVPLQRIYSAKELEKFGWAMDAPASFKF